MCEQAVKDQQVMKDQRISFRLNPDERKALKEMSVFYECPESEILRRAIKFSLSVRFQPEYLLEPSTGGTPKAFRLSVKDRERLEKLWESETVENSIKIRSALMVFKAKAYDKCHTVAIGSNTELSDVVSYRNARSSSKSPSSIRS